MRLDATCPASSSANDGERKGNVQVEPISPRVGTGSGDLIEFRVTDNGVRPQRPACLSAQRLTAPVLCGAQIGIPKDKLRDIFAPFTQATSATSHQYGGTGLGLTISEQLVRMMGGRLCVKSEPGRGSTF
jgi:signal transduction histidine kinase